MARDCCREAKRRKTHIVVYVSSEDSIFVHLKLAWCPWTDAGAS